MHGQVLVNLHRGGRDLRIDGADAQDPWDHPVRALGRPDHLQLHGPGVILRHALHASYGEHPVGREADSL